ncbi:GNAT family N-acetyltransferase [Jeongeupia naejangsanensis]|uniref:GNAT family N-acetyltransferase n=1 Tax=Jeongeupia naejangsanensis TaxID=613195 RepID=A0ABS2BNN9_9NEIS|nr:GNAT family N-acetyltransferase [Jeongeupia naejangsanensis]MBM3116678.1 GNAT family N-acetyltransferase [Jeongeupia naejangsanensis]
MHATIDAPALVHPHLRLRTVTAEDQPFLLRLYASTRADELGALGWQDAQRDAFVQMQFVAQQRAYFAYPDAAFWLVLHDDTPVGRLYLQHAEEALRIIDLSLLPEYRNRGLGTALLTACFAQDKPVQLHVDKTNPVLQLYLRLGFVPIEDKGVYLQMERRPDPH